MDDETPARAGGCLADGRHYALLNQLCLRRSGAFLSPFSSLSTLPIILIFIERAGAVAAHPPAPGGHRKIANGRNVAVLGRGCLREYLILMGMGK